MAETETKEKEVIATEEQRKSAWLSLQRAFATVKKEKPLLCKNAELSVDQVEKGIFNVVGKNVEFEMKNAGCANDRRSGSAYCQQCADDHNNSNKK